jgi:hypothetical protein
MVERLACKDIDGDPLCRLWMPGNLGTGFPRDHVPAGTAQSRDCGHCLTRTLGRLRQDGRVCRTGDITQDVMFL